jgi:hypothetical protein
VDVILGLDFGSAFTKVVALLPHEGVAPVPLRLAPRGSPLAGGLLPSALAADGLALAGHDGDAGAWRRDLKLKLMRSLDHAPSLATPAGFHAATFLALVVRRARAAVTEQLGHLIADRPLFWHLNLGVPCRREDWPRREVFLRLARAAWTLAAREHDPAASAAAFREAVTAAESGPETPGVEIAVAPEAVAGAIGFSRMVRRQGGMHLVLDVGASTLDLCAVSSLTRDGETSWGVIEDDVQELGAVVLHRERVRAVREAVEVRCAGADDDILRTDRVPDGLDGLLPEPIGCGKAVAAVEDGFLNRCLEMAMGMAVELRRRRNPAASCPGAHLNLVVCGGGADLPFYRRLVAEFDRRARDRLRLGGVRVVAPELLGDVPADRLRRLSVALGLAGDRSAFERVLGPDELPDIGRALVEPDAMPWDQSRYIEK